MVHWCYEIATSSRVEREVAVDCDSRRYAAANDHHFSFVAQLHHCRDLKIDESWTMSACCCVIDVRVKVVPLVLPFYDGVCVLLQFVCMLVVVGEKSVLYRMFEKRVCVKKELLTTTMRLQRVYTCHSLLQH